MRATLLKAQSGKFMGSHFNLGTIKFQWPYNIHNKSVEECI